MPLDEEGKFILILYKRWFSQLRVFPHITKGDNREKILNNFGDSSTPENNECSLRGEKYSQPNDIK